MESSSDSNMLTLLRKVLSIQSNDHWCGSNEPKQHRHESGIRKSAHFRTLPRRSELRTFPGRLTQLLHLTILAFLTSKVMKTKTKPLRKERAVAGLTPAEV